MDLQQLHHRAAVIPPMVWGLSSDVWRNVLSWELGLVLKQEKKKEQGNVLFALLSEYFKG